MISGEAAYQSANSGFYGNLTCLATPASCIPGYTSAGPTFLDSSLASSTTIIKQGYTRTWFEQAATAGTAGLTRSRGYVLLRGAACGCEQDGRSQLRR